MTHTDNASAEVTNHLQASKALIAAGLMQYQRELPDEYSTLVGAANAGALFTVTTSFSVQGLVEIAVSLTTPNAVTINLMNVEFGTHAPSMTSQ